MLGSSLQQYQQWPIGIWIHGLHYEYGVTHVLRDAEKLEELLYVYESCVNHIGEQKKDSVLSWQPLSPRYYQYIKWNTLPELQAFKGAKVSRPHPLSSKTDMHWCFEGLSNRIVHFSTGKSSDKTDTIQHGITAPMFYEACRINKTRQSEASLLRSKLSNSCGFQLSGVAKWGGAELCRTQTEHFQIWGICSKDLVSDRKLEAANLRGLISVWWPCAASLLHNKHICTASVMYRQNLDKFGK